jgi:antirestriction protein ArdC
MRKECSLTAADGRFHTPPQFYDTRCRVVTNQGDDAVSSQTELRTQITRQIVDALTAGGLPPWRQPWRADKNCGTAANVVSKRSYTGINPLLLAIASHKHDFQSRWWGTFNQWKELGGQVKARPSHIPPGKWGTQIVFCRPVTKTQKTQDGDEEDKTFFFLRSYCVFNLDQVEGASLDHLRAGNAPLTAAEMHTRHEEAERVIGATFADIRHGGDRAFYRTKEDFIQLPHREQFVTPEAYYETAFHELTHWTEHPSRLDWDRGEKENSYALGELVAELGACYLMGEAGLPTADTWANSAAYLGHWLKAMNADPRLVFRATAQASRATDHVLSYSRILTTEEQPA